MLTIENLSLEIDGKKIFTKLGFSLGVSGVLIVRGKNGSGKSSLLKIIAGILQPNAGRILWQGKNIKDFSDDFYGDMQFLGHKNFLKPELSVFENLNFYARIADTECALSSALQFFDLEQFKDIPVKKLSAGWQQRAILAKLLACPATIWLLDEVSSNLDLAGKKKLYGLIKARSLENKGLVLMATHDEMFFDLGEKLEIEDFA